MKEMDIVKVLSGKNIDVLGEIHRIDNSLFKPYYVMFNNGDGEWFEKIQITPATDQEIIAFLRMEVSELHKHLETTYAELDCLEFDFKMMMKLIENPNDGLIRIAKKRGYNLNSKYSTKKLFPPDVI